jgi:hypothetical protein
MVGLSAGTALVGMAAVARASAPARGDDTVVSVRNFGAIGDGHADDTAALRAAAATGEALRVPAGRYVLTGDVTFRAPVHFDYQAALWASGDVAITFNGELFAGLQLVFALEHAARVILNPQFTTVGHPEWWGARSNDPDFDCQPAIQAALRACNRTVLQGANYYIASTVKILDHGHSLEGVAASQNGENSAGTRLMLTSETADGIQVGFDRPPPSGQHWLEHGRVSDLTVQRVARIANPGAGFEHAPCGVRLQWAVTCYLDRVETIEHSHGFYITGTVHCYLRLCQAFRFKEGAIKANDFFNGFFMDNSAPTPFNSGNASLYIQNCSTFSTHAVRFTESSGIKSYRGYTDTFITGFECAGVGYGLNMNGRTSDGADAQTEDLIIDTCVIDSVASAGVSINLGAGATAVQIHNCYVAPVGKGAALLVRDSKGAVGITGCQVIASPDNEATGLKITTSSGVSSMNNIFTNIRNPVVVNGADNLRLMDTINNLGRTSAVAAIQIEQLDRGYIAPMLTGHANAHPVGVALLGNANRNIEVSGTGIRPSCIIAGAVNAVVCDGKPVTMAGPFGANNHLSGIVG